MSDPPEIQFSLDTIEKDMVPKGFLGKKHLFPTDNSFPEVPVEIERTSSGTIAKIMTGKAISGMHPLTPHGYYLARLRCVNGDCQSFEKPFNFIYKEDFGNINKALRIHDPDAFSGIPSGGVRMENPVGSKHSVWADVGQEFDLSNNFWSSGAFTISCGRLDPAALDIAFCDRWGERLGAVMPDGFLNAISIKFGNESVLRPGVRRRFEGPKPVIVPDGQTLHHFRIVIRELGHDQMLFSLQVWADTVDSPSQSFTHERIFPGSALGDGFRKIRIRGRKPGVIVLRELQVGEIPPGNP